MGGKYDRKDHLYQRAKDEGYRARSSYKLVEVNKRFKLLRTGSRVVDLGCAPGGWIQVARELAGPRGVVVGVDLERVEPLADEARSAPVTLIRGDILDSAVRAELLHATGGPVDLLLSDMSPHLSGIRFRDVARAAELGETVFGLAAELLKKGGSIVVKVFPGSETDDLVKANKPRFLRLDRVKLDSTRKTSTEMYLVGLGFNGE